MTLSEQKSKITLHFQCLICEKSFCNATVRQLVYVWAGDNPWTALDNLLLHAACLPRYASQHPDHPSVPLPEIFSPDYNYRRYLPRQVWRQLKDLQKILRPS